MELNNIKRFSEAYYSLKEYFSRVEPYKYQQKSIFPQITGPLTIRKGFNAEDWDLPYSYNTFKSLYDSFIEELDNAVLDYTQIIVLTMLNVHFSNLKKVFEYSLDDVFEFDREDLIELIELFNKSTTLICNLRNDSKTTYEFGVIGYYDSYKEEAMKRREKRISEPQVKEETYTDEDVEDYLQRINETSKVIANELTRKFFDDKAFKPTQNSNLVQSEELLSIFRNDKKILDTFLFRIKGESGVKVVIEVQALMELNKIRKEKVNRPLWKELSKIQYIGTESNWNSVLNNKHIKQVKAVVNEYQCS